MNFWPKMGFGTLLLEQFNLFKAKEFMCVWVVLLSAENVEVSVSALLSSEECVELEVLSQRDLRKDKLYLGSRISYWSSVGEIGHILKMT